MVKNNCRSADAPKSVRFENGISVRFETEWPFGMLRNPHGSHLACGRRRIDSRDAAHISPRSNLEAIGCVRIPQKWRLVGVLAPASLFGNACARRARASEREDQAGHSGVGLLLALTRTPSTAPMPLFT